MSRLTLKEIKDQLETLVDSHNLASVLQTLAYVCSDKADHLQENWQDTCAARHWQAASSDLDRLARTQENRTGERQQYP